MARKPQVLIRIDDYVRWPHEDFNGALHARQRSQPCSTYVGSGSSKSSFFLQFFPDLVREGHVYILDTPLFRVRNKKKTFYCYSEKEKRSAIKELGGKPEITRFKGLGEISPDEFGAFIGEDIKLDPLILQDDTSIEDLLKYYMGKKNGKRGLK